MSCACRSRKVWSWTRPNKLLMRWLKPFLPIQLHVARRSWVPVIQELRVVGSLIFLAHRDLSVPWCPEVSLCDASLQGGPVVAALVPATVVKENVPLLRSLAVFPPTGVRCSLPFSD